MKRGSSGRNNRNNSNTEHWLDIYYTLGIILVQKLVSIDSFNLTSRGSDYLCFTVEEPEARKVK